MNKLKIILQSKTFWLIFLIGIILDVFINTKIIVYQTKYLPTINNITGKIINLKIDGDKVSMQIKTKEENIS